MLPVYIFNIVRQICNVKEDTKTTKNLSEFSFFSNITEEIGENLQRSTYSLFEYLAENVCSKSICRSFQRKICFTNKQWRKKKYKLKPTLPLIVYENAPIFILFISCTNYR